MHTLRMITLLITISLLLALSFTLTGCGTDEKNDIGPATLEPAQTVSNLPIVPCPYDVGTLCLLYPDGYTEIFNSDVR